MFTALGSFALYRFRARLRLRKVSKNSRCKIKDKEKRISYDGELLNFWDNAINAPPRTYTFSPDESYTYTSALFMSPSTNLRNLASLLPRKALERVDRCNLWKEGKRHWAWRTTALHTPNARPCVSQLVGDYIGTCRLTVIKSKHLNQSPEKVTQRFETCSAFYIGVTKYHEKKKAICKHKQEVCKHVS